MIHRALQHDEQVWTLLMVALVTMPHLGRLPVWLGVALVATLLWRGWLLMRPRIGRRGDAGTGLRRVLTLGVPVALVLGVVATYGPQLGRDASVALLTVLLGLKLLELRTERDFYIVTLLGLFTLVTHFFYAQSPLVALYMVLVVVLMLSGLIRVNDPRARQGLRQRLRLAGVIVAQAMPLMLIAFLLFPRLPGPLWGLPRDAYSGLTGLSGEISPGSVTQLALTEDIAFRAEFKNQILPPLAQLYWRGPVMWDTDGRRWSAGTPDPAARIFTPAGPEIAYSITLEPSNKPWLLVLDRPLTVPALGRLTGDYQLIARVPVRRRVAYSAVSVLAVSGERSDPTTLARALALPAGAHPRTVALARRWREAEAGDPERIAQRALALFRQDSYFYTLSPPAFLVDPVDEFMFQSKRGFCEHFAVAFTVLMRAAGVPARVVTGYQGGEVNSVGNFLTVRQRDAHAWSEIYVPPRGWVRYDPTAAVAPSRVSLGIDAAIAVGGAGMSGAFTTVQALNATWIGLRDGWEAVTYKWNQWVLGYSARRQAELLARMGLPDLGNGMLGAGLVLAVGAVVSITAVVLLRRRARHSDPALRLYDRFCARMARLGIGRGPSEGPLDFARRATSARPDLAAPIARITALYCDLRYGRARQSEREDLQRAVASFRPSRQIRAAAARVG